MLDSMSTPSTPPAPEPAHDTSHRTPLHRRPVTWVIAAAVVIVLAVGAFFIGSRIYADQQNADAPTAFATATAAGSGASDGETSGDVTGTWTVGTGSQAGYRVDEVLNGKDVTVVGRTENTSGSATIEGTSLTATEVTVDLTTVATDAGRRDEYFRTQAIDTSAHPDATFTLTEPVDVAALADAGSASVTAQGTLAINGRTQDVQIALTLAQGTDGTLSVIGSSDLTWSDYGVEAPNLGFVSVQDAGQIEFSLVLTRS